MRTATQDGAVGTRSRGVVVGALRAAAAVAFVAEVAEVALAALAVAAAVLGIGVFESGVLAGTTVVAGVDVSNGRSSNSSAS